MRTDGSAPDPGERDPLEHGLRAVFGASSAPMSSVLRILQSKTQVKLGVHLPDAKDEHGDILKVSAESKSLRDTAGRYQVIGEIGRGGVGVVYKGHDVDLGRDVALKVLREEFTQHPEVLARFVEEAQIGGQLQHPGIVPVYEIGLQNGERPFFAMKLVKGETLAEQLERRKDPGEDRRRLLGIFEQVCQTVAFAHARRVVHRDLKPGNIMIGSFGEVQIVDWGFAKVLPKPGGEAAPASKRADAPSQVSVISTVRSTPNASSHSIVGSTMGTPAYMPPEQALGDVEHMDQRSDVFGLGAILCEILTGQAVYLVADGDLIQQAGRGDLSRAHARVEGCGADASLIALCKQCLSPSRLARPASAREVAAEIGAYLSSVEERAREAHIRAAEAKVKARSTALLSAAALLIVVLGGGGYAWVQHSAAVRREQASQRVAEAMSEASGLVGQARSAGLGDPSLWDRALSVAEQAERLARNEDVGDEQRAQVARQLAGAREQSLAAQQAAARASRDSDMLRDLDEARIPVDEDVRGKDWDLKEATRLDSTYAECFRKYLGGTDLLGLDLEVAAKLLEEGDIEVALAAALDHWTLQHQLMSKASKSPEEATTLLQQLAQRIDSEDAWRSDLRERLSQPQRNRIALENLAQVADFDGLSPTSILLLGNVLWFAGAKDAAVEAFRHGLSSHPSDFVLSFRLGLNCELLEKPRRAEAITSYRIAHALHPEMREVRHRLAMALEANKELAEALELFRGLSLGEPESVHWINHIGNVLEAQGESDAAIEAYTEAIAADPTDTHGLANLGHLHQEHGRLDEAVACLRRAIERDPKAKEVWVGLGGALQRQGHLDEAVECYRKAIEIDPRYALARASLGNVLSAQGRLDESIESLLKAIRLDPKPASAYSSLGTALLRRGDTAAGVASLRKAIELDPLPATTYGNLCVGLRDLGRLEEAVAVARKAVELGPTLAWLQVNLSGALFDNGQLDEALAAARAALQLEPDLSDAYSSLGAVLHGQGHIEESLVNDRKAIELDPGDAKLHVNLGVVLKAAGRMEEAIASFRKAIEMDATCAAAYGALGEALMDQGRLDEAIASHRKAIELNPKDGGSYNGLGLSLQRQGRVEEAVETFRKALEIDPEYGPAHVNLGDIQHRGGQLEDALAHFRHSRGFFGARRDAFSVKWAKYSEKRIEELKGLIEQAPALLAIVRGEREASSATEWSDAADLAMTRKEHLAALRICERALAADPKLAKDVSIDLTAAACAALAGCGKAGDAGALTEVERAGLRGKALSWMRGRLTVWRARVEQAGTEREEAVGELEWAQKDADLAGVREEESLKLLSAEEADAWRALWREIAELLAKGRSKN